jgi:hypothetical protein
MIPRWMTVSAGLSLLVVALRSGGLASTVPALTME